MIIPKMNTFKTLFSKKSIMWILLFPTMVFSQNYKQYKDIHAIKAMAGCYEVEFKYTETFAPEVDYEKAYDYTSAAFEWAQVIEESDDKIVIQHLLIINDSMIIKHWRQDWLYENTHQYRYDGDNNWVFESLDEKEVKGKWTQNVYQVDDSPRYSGTATWSHIDGVSSWYNKADSPLPRREYTKRSDYNVMKRGNRVQILEDGWLHEQDNDKVIRSHEEDVLLVQEKGYNVYTKRDDEACIAAQNWWKENESKWAEVRDVWADIYERKQDIKLHTKVDDKALYENLFYANEKWSASELSQLINKYIVEPTEQM